MRSKKPKTITPEAIAAYRRALALYNGQDAWEEQGGTRRAYLNAAYELNKLLGRQIWDEQVLHTIGCDDPETLPTGIYRPWDVDSWKEAVTIRLELERLVANALR